MQTILSRRADDNYNYVDAREYEQLSDAVAPERSSVEQVEHVVEMRLETKERQSQAVSRRSQLESNANPKGALKPLIQLDAEQRSEAGSMGSVSRRPPDSLGLTPASKQLGSRR